MPVPPRKNEPTDLRSYEDWLDAEGLTYADLRKGARVCEPLAHPKTPFAVMQGRTHALLTLLDPRLKAQFNCPSQDEVALNKYRAAKAQECLDWESRPTL